MCVPASRRFDAANFPWTLVFRSSKVWRFLFLHVFRSYRFELKSQKIEQQWFVQLNGAFLNIRLWKWLNSFFSFACDHKCDGHSCVMRVWVTSFVKQRWEKWPIGCGITYCIRNEEVVSQQSVVQQGGNDALQAHRAPVGLQGGHPHKQRLVARPETQTGS